MSLNILSVAYPFAPVSRDSAGGAEQVLANLDRALVERGHRSVVVACEGSSVQGELIPIPSPAAELGADAQVQTHKYMRLAIQDALRHCDFDLIHMHGIDFHAYLPSAGVPLLVTLHLPPAWYPPEIFRLNRPDTYLQCVSESQHSRCPPSPHLVPPIRNGVPVDEYVPRQEKSDYALALGRVCPEKGFHLALDACEAAGIPLVIAGPVYDYPAHRSYFASTIQPRINGRDVRWVGPVGLERKRELLAQARCLLVPSLAPETSSLVAMEALASATPVIARPAGALKDIVRHGETGFLADDAPAIAEAIHRVASIQPQRCRDYAVRNCRLDSSVAQYLETYDRLSGRPH